MKKLWIAAAVLALAAIPALAAEATFDKTLSINGRLELSVSTGSGNIHITHGAGNQVHIFGKVKSGWGGSEEKVRADRADGQHRPHWRPSRESSQHQHRLRDSGTGRCLSRCRLRFGRYHR